MLKTPKGAIPITACALVFALAASAVSVAAIQRFPVSNMGKQKGATIMGLKTTPKRAPTHAVAVHKVMALSIGQHLVGPPLRESGMGKLKGAVIMGAKGTPKRQPTLSVTQRQ
jgi:hypothetical protein